MNNFKFRGFIKKMNSIVYGVHLFCICYLWLVSGKTVLPTLHKIDWYYDIYICIYICFMAFVFYKRISKTYDSNQTILINKKCFFIIIDELKTKQLYITEVFETKCILYWSHDRLLAQKISDWKQLFFKKLGKWHPAFCMFFDNY